MPSSEDGVAFIGLGVMGYGMAVNLRSKLDRSKTFYICDVSEDAINRFKLELDGQGPIEVVQNGTEAVAVADTVFSMLPDSAAVKSVYLEISNGVIAGVRKAAAASPVRKLIVECGTIESATISEVSKAASDAEKTLPEGSVLDFVDAPVSGGPNGARGGTLAFMVGTDRPDSVFDRVKSMLVHMGKPDSIFLCGDVGAGTAFKVINNYISAIVSLASSEALNIGVKLGLDPKRLTDVINASGGMTWVTANINPVPGVMPNVPSSRNYEGGFRIELCKKVLEMGSELAKQANAKTVLDKPTIQAFEEAAADERYKGKDARVVYRWLNEST
ncbi:hypothetical protein LTR37_007256 [Vermiconidia calcicola]|uniref:Uncharacterized protein n=1 Tax=Vermiconidia calcicola TaxID=1690605 RepID=A0ACC3NGZ9_9PEZI|nr:hypothetical protein LTR37_007256 [Vermiconidia calcicola]